MGCITRVIATGFALGAILLFSGCGNESTSPTSTPSASAPAGPVVLAIKASDPGMATQVGIKDTAHGLVATGKAGYLMFGPYAPLPAGKYTVTIDGSIQPGAAAPVVFDVVYGQGGHALARQTLTAPPGNAGAPLASMDIDVPAGVTDLEVRASVPDGMQMAITGYTIAKRE